MRSRSFALLLGLVLCVVSHAQSAGIGVKGGILVSSVHAVNIRTSPIPGATAGMYFPWGIGPRVELQPELLITALGTVYTEPDGDRYAERLIYFQVPLLIKLYLNNGLNVSAGYQFAKPLAAIRTVNDAKVDVRDRYELLDMGFVGGVGMDFRSGLDLSLRAYSAMTPSLRNDDALFSKNRSVQLTLGYRFVQFRGSRNGRRRS